MSAKEEFTHGYCDPDGNFLGYNSTMTLIPGLIPAKRHNETGKVTFTGNPKVIPKGQVLRTEIDQNGTENVMSGLVEDKGADTAPTGSVPGSDVPQNEDSGEDASRSEELEKKIASRKKASTTKDS